MSPYGLMGWLFAAVIATIIASLIFSRRKQSITVGGDYGTDDHQPDTFYRDGGITGYGAPKDERVTFGKRVIGKHPGLAAPYKRQTISLTPRQIERVNIQRRLRGKPVFNRTGLTNAISHPWDRADVRQPQTSNDWLSYLIMYEIFFADHQGSKVSGCGGVTIDPGAPYNGQGGEFAGAGASGDWSDPVIRAQAAAVEHGVPFASDADPKYSPGDVVNDYGSRSFDVVTDKPDTSNTSTYTPDPAPSTPSYTAPDPAPSAPSVSDSSSSYSSSSDSSSSSSSSDSGSSGGDDSGGGGGGGGGD